MDGRREGEKVCQEEMKGERDGRMVERDGRMVERDGRMVERDGRIEGERDGKMEGAGVAWMEGGREGVPEGKDGREGWPDRGRRRLQDGEGSMDGRGKRRW